MPPRYLPKSLTELDADTLSRIETQIGHMRMAVADRDGGLCGACLGAGYLVYPDTSTWRRKPSGQAMAPGVCDECWGSGSAIPWPSHRLLRV